VNAEVMRDQLLRQENSFRAEGTDESQIYLVSHIPKLFFMVKKKQDSDM
jgi:hypothetical protein